MDFVRSYFCTNEPLTSWTLFSSLFGRLSADPAKKWGKKCSTGQRFICTEVTSYKIHILVEIFYEWSYKFWTIRSVMEMANPLLESFGEPPRIRVTNSSCPPTDLKGKETPDLPLVCSNYWPPIMALSLCFNHLVILTFRQCRFAIPKRSAKPIASIHHTVEYP
jgi:hypothetical protein